MDNSTIRSVADIIPCNFLLSMIGILWILFSNITSTAFKIEESAKQIGKQVEELSRHIKAYDEYFKKVGNSLSTTVNHYNAAQKELGKIDKDVLRITGESADIEMIALDKPVKEE